MGIALETNTECMKRHLGERLPPNLSTKIIVKLWPVGYTGILKDITFCSLVIGLKLERVFPFFPFCFEWFFFFFCNLGLLLTKIKRDCLKSREYL